MIERSCRRRWAFTLGRAANGNAYQITADSSLVDQDQPLQQQLNTISPFSRVPNTMRITVLNVVASTREVARAC